MKTVLITAAMATALALPGWANTSYEPEGVIEIANERLATYLEDGILQAGEAEEFLDMIAVEQVGRFVLGKNARSASEDEMTAFQTAFKGYLGEQLQTHLGDMENVSFKVTNKIERDAEDMVIETEVTGDADNLSEVNWRLNKIDGEWKIVDVEAMDMWLALEQRAQFDAKLDANGGDVAALAAEL
ncbi:MAG: hypothetical protein CMK09_15190 [Ponticaulis sp.]|nr:hypothetical protein [Ponticaulis sp.]|tara:strand:+ start:20890 stop:21447 length:558 start_codon:yes stop_codon:yes gene_type:complete